MVYENPKHVGVYDVFVIFNFSIILNITYCFDISARV